MEYIKEQNHLKNYFQLLKNFFASSKIVQFIADTRLRRVIRGASPSKYNALIKIIIKGTIQRDFFGWLGEMIKIDNNNIPDDTSFSNVRLEILETKFMIYLQMTTQDICWLSSYCCHCTSCECNIKIWNSLIWISWIWFYNENFWLFENNLSFLA